MAVQHAIRTSVCVFVLLSSTAYSIGAVPIEGDPNLVEVVLAALETNRQRFLRGSLDGEMTVVWGKSVSHGTATMTWDGQNCYWRYSHVKHDKTFPNQKEHKTGEIIETGTQRITYLPKSRLLHFAADKNMFGLYWGLKMRPDQIWFSTPDITSATELLDPASYPDSLSKYVIRKEGNDQIVVERHYKTRGYYTSTVSLAQGGNLVSYDTIQSGDEPLMWIRGRYNWAPAAGGIWYLQSYLAERSIAGSEDKIDLMYDLKVKRFDPAPLIPANRFKMKSLDLLPGTNVKEYDKAGNLVHSRTVGRVTTRIPQDTFENLARKLSQMRFAGGRK